IPDRVALGGVVGPPHLLQASEWVGRDAPVDDRRLKRVDEHLDPVVGGAMPARRPGVPHLPDPASGDIRQKDVAGVRLDLVKVAWVRGLRRAREAKEIGGPVVGPDHPANGTGARRLRALDLRQFREDSIHLGSQSVAAVRALERPAEVTTAEVEPYAAG